jgi:hypothetical protein
MDRRTTLALSATALLCLGATLSVDPAAAQTAKDVVGTWMSVSNINIRADGSKAAVFGPNGKGMAIFESNGRFAIVNINPDVAKFASNNRAQGTPAENKAAMEGGIALFGTYSVAEKVLTLKIEGSTYPNWTGTEQKRNLTLSGDELKYSLAASIGGTAEVTYKRVK